MAELEINEGFSIFDDTLEEANRLIYSGQSLILKLDIGSCVKDLVIHENDDPEEAVSRFCLVNRLPGEVRQGLLAKVFENLAPAASSSKVPAKRFVKKGNFIKKEVNDRARSALRPAESRLSPSRPCRPAAEDSRFHESPIVRNKFRLESGVRLLAKPSQQISITQYVPTKVSDLNKASKACKVKHSTFNDKSCALVPTVHQVDTQDLNSNSKQFSSTSNSNLSITPCTSCSLSIKSSVSSKLSLNSSEYSQKLSKRLFSQEQSQTILNRIRFLKIKKIFEMIDDQRSGFVSQENFSSALEPNLCKILKPILDEISGKHLKLCLGEFESKVDVLLTRLPHNERMLLLGV